MAGRREQIVEAALELVSEEGTPGLTMMNIAERIGTSDAALYRHFRSKQEIMEAMIRRFGGDLLRAAREAAREAPDPVEGLRRMMQTQIEHIVRRRALPRMILLEEVHMQDEALKAEVERVVRGYLDLVQEKLGEAQREGQVPTDVDVEAAAVTFLGTVQSSAVLWSLNPERFPLLERAPALWEVFTNSIRLGAGKGPDSEAFGA